ncbi:flagellar basal body P-ring formation chaperone FlgA [Pseudodesulfovibrio indicus]|uniref:flagellar basal body P-ring formation chaperone FlgA n=1 Tax=Pseudodesulfovibrio indicus TaxID=1716143 RepID=UPI00293191D7|nr:flagellar basal body P-ring formation chaperone FlgA [Pseudodesulfovibrio indicus]
MSRKWSLSINGKTALRAGLALCLGLVVLASPVGTGAAKGGKWQALVRDAVCVKGPDVLLGEIADPVDATARSQWKSLAGIKLWQASDRPGHVVNVNRDKLEKVLRYYLGEMAGNLVLPNQMAVQTGGKVINDAELKERLVAFLTPRGKDLGGDVEFKNLQMPGHIFLQSPLDKLVISMNSDLEPGRNEIVLSGIGPDGRVLSRRSAVVFVDVWKTVPVAAKPLNRMERLTKDKVSFRRVNLAYKPEVWDGTGGPWRMARTLGRGQVFTMSHLEQVPLIEKGEMVTLVYNGNRVRLSIKAEALGEGGAGQLVQVRNVQSNKVIMATVVDSDTVVVR